MKIFGIVAAVLVVLVLTFAVVKKVSPLSWGMWGTTNTSSGLALEGYDPVSYFESGGPNVGMAQHSYEWADATWHFASAANQELFASNPGQYAPQFGSFCTFATSKGVTAVSDPTAWQIEGGALYVFADKNVRDDWVAGLPEGSLETSQANWAKR